MKTPQPACPECEKLSKVSEESNKIGDFLDWLRNTKNQTLCELNDRATEYVPTHIGFGKLLAEYFEIDLRKVDDERRELLKWLRENHPKF